MLFRGASGLGYCFWIIVSRTKFHRDLIPEVFESGFCFGANAPENGEGFSILKILMILGSRAIEFVIASIFMLIDDEIQPISAIFCFSNVPFFTGSTKRPT